MSSNHDHSHAAHGRAPSDGHGEHHHGHGYHDVLGHGHGGHHHAPANYGRAFLLGITLNIAFVLIEVTAGFWTDSMALLADAGHNLSDVLGLCVAWAGAHLAKRAPSKRFTYGLRSSSILAALANALILIFALGAIALEAVQRLHNPPPVAGRTVIIVALIGIVINVATAMLFSSGRKADINIRGAYLHMMSDAAVSFGVVLAGIAILQTGAGWIDPVVSLVIAAIILWQTWGLLKESVALALGGVPRGIDYDDVVRAMTSMPGVLRVHDLHIWPMSTTETVLTAHIAVTDQRGNGLLRDVRAMLAERFAIDHTTIQIETEDDGACVTDCHLDNSGTDPHHGCAHDH